MFTHHRQQPGLRLMSSKADRSLEGVASGYWTRFAKPVSGPSATAVQLTKVSLDSAFCPVDHKNGLADRVVSTAGQAPAAPE